MYMTIKNKGVYLLQIDEVYGHSVKDLMKDAPTPSSLEELYGDQELCEKLNLIDRGFLVEVMRWGGVYGYKQEQFGRKVQNLFPIKKDQDRQISSSSKAVLEMHTEAAFHPYKPHYLALMCVRSNPEAGTTFSCLSDIIELLSDETKAELRLPNFYTRPDASYSDGITGDPTIKVTVLSNDDSVLTFDRDLMRGINPMAAKALDDLNVAIEKVKRVIYLDVGQVLTLNNEQVVHGRTAFTPRYDGTDRWLKRALLRVVRPPETDVAWDNDHFVITTDFVHA